MSNTAVQHWYSSPPTARPIQKYRASRFTQGVENGAATNCGNAYFARNTHLSARNSPYNALEPVAGLVSVVTNASAWEQPARMATNVSTAPSLEPQPAWLRLRPINDDKRSTVASLQAHSTHDPPIRLLCSSRRTLGRAVPRDSAKAQVWEFGWQGGLGLRPGPAGLGCVSSW